MKHERNLWHGDNQPNYYTSRGPAYIGVSFAVVARSKPVHTDPDDMCDPVSQTFLIEPVRVEGSADKQAIQHVIARALLPTPCSCEYDCCGHRHGWAETRWFDMDRLEVTISTSRNY